MHRHLRILLAAATVAVASGADAAPVPSGTLEMKPCQIAGVKGEVRCGTYRVPENRAKPPGRMLSLNIVVLPARHPVPGKGPVFFFSGGPGQAATDEAPGFVDSWERDEHDLVLIDQRGMGRSGILKCRLPGTDAHLESYFEPIYQGPVARACRQELESRADLAQYSTFAMVADTDEVRRALGYDTINVEGGSYGTYLSLMYIKAHPDRVRAAYLYSLAAPENRLPLHHAEAAQDALNVLFKECEADAPCHKAYPHFPEDFAAVAAALRAHSVETTVQHPETHAPTKIVFTYTAFADAVRVMMYDGGRGFPYLIDRAKKGDYAPLAQTAMETSRGFYSGVPLGIQLSVTCSEFASRIRPEDIGPVTRNTFLGESRVRGQLAACSEWPTAPIPADAFAPFRADVPALLISGSVDPVTRPYWSREYQRRLPNNMHVVIPGGGHAPVTQCTDNIAKALFDRGTFDGVDTGCVAHMLPPPFRLPG